jgi:DNA transposition AAA+ family ATPase
MHGRSISLLYGRTGLGKTESALHYTNWREVSPLLVKASATRAVPRSVVQCGAAIYTPDVAATPKMVQSGISLLRNKFDDLVDQAACWHRFDTGEFVPHKYLKLLIVDESDRLKPASLEYIRDLYDRTNLSILLIGSPGIERRLQRAAYGQLFSRFTLAYKIEPLTEKEAETFIALKWTTLGLPIKADGVVAAAISKLAGGNFRTLHRIFAELERLQKLNRFPMITPDVLDMARRGLLLADS